MDNGRPGPGHIFALAAGNLLLKGEIKGDATLSRIISKLSAATDTLSDFVMSYPVAVEQKKDVLYKAYLSKDGYVGLLDSKRPDCRTRPVLMEGQRRPGRGLKRSMKCMATVLQQLNPLNVFYFMGILHLCLSKMNVLTVMGSPTVDPKSWPSNHGACEKLFPRCDFSPDAWGTSFVVLQRMTDNERWSRHLHCNCAGLPPE
ncbi:hypothetical protein GN956_G2251 [Arapaima gigas]